MDCSEVFTAYLQVKPTLDFLCKRPQRESYQSCAEVGCTTEGSELPSL